MTIEQIKQLFPNASASFIKANLSAGSPRPAPVVESSPGHAPLEARQVQKATGQRFLVRVVSVRKRLLDEDNLCEKFHVDLLRPAH